MRKIIRPGASSQREYGYMESESHAASYVEGMCVLRIRVRQVGWLHMFINATPLGSLRTASRSRDFCSPAGAFLRLQNGCKKQ